MLRLIVLASCLWGLSMGANAQGNLTPAMDFSAWGAGNPQTGLRIIGVVVHARGGKHSYKVEVAGTPRQQATGMMYRKSMKRDEGMLFPMNPARPAGFFMRNTYVPLDIIFIGPDRKVLNIGQGKPLDETVIHSDGPVIAVLELKGGEAKRIGLKPGDRVEW